MKYIDYYDFLYKKESTTIKNIRKIFQMFGLSIKKRKFENFIKKLLNLYNILNFHNSNHCIDVFYTIVDILLETHVYKYLPKDDIFMLLITTLSHDIKHMGFVNSNMPSSLITKENSFLEDKDISINSTKSFNEYMHIQTTQSLLTEHIHDIYGEKINKIYINTFINNIILATDLQLHDKYIPLYQDVQSKNIFENKMLILTLFMKAADLGHALKDFKIHVQWVFNIKKEQNISMDTIWFNNTFTLPLYTHIDRLFQTNYVKRVHKNLDIWKLYI